MTYERALLGMLVLAGALPLGLGVVAYNLPRDGAVAAALLLLALVVAFAVAGARLLGDPIRRLRVGVELMVGPNPRFRVRPSELRDLAALAAALNRLAERAELARSETESQLLVATRELASEKDTLASILFALADGVLVCNQDLQVVLSNAGARRMLSQPSRPLRRGERLHQYLDATLVGPLVESLAGEADRVRLERAITALPNGATVQVTATVAGSEELGRHYVFVLRDVTHQVTEDRSRDRFIAETVQRLRGPAAALLSLAEILRGYGELDDRRRHEFLDALVLDAERLAEELDAIQETAGAGLAPSWAQDLEFGGLIQRAVVEAEPILAARGQRIASGGDDATVRGDRLALIQLLCRLIEQAGARAADGAEIALRWRLVATSERSPLVELSIELPGPALDPSALERVFDAPLHGGQIGWTEAAPTIRSVAREHRGELWARSAPRGAAYVLVLPTGPEPSAPPIDLEADAVGRQVLALLGRDGFYHLRPPTTRVEPAHADALLSELSYAVFDLETTGLEPAGDRVLSIGAVRVRGGQIIREDYFFSLVQPGRPIPAASTRIHGITDDHVVGQPRLEEVLPRFVEWVGASVPVAHVASFDLAFLNPRLDALGLPPLGGTAVLDTLLLTYSLFPTWDGYNLEEIAHHFDVEVVGRHTSLGDALVTAEILLRLLTVLDQRGVERLGELLGLQGGDALRKAVGAVRARLAWG